MIGLIITGIKIYYNKTNWYLIKSNFAIWFSILSLSCVIDWDLLITRYNLQNKPSYQIDYYYLFSLSETNIPELFDYCEKRIATETKPLPRSEKEREAYYYYSQFDYLNLLNDKIERYLRDYNKDWRSWDLRDERIMKSLKLDQ
jgi:hypothetical protein